MGAREVTQALNGLTIAAVGGLLGLRLPAKGMSRCPFPDHSDSKPSFEVRGEGRRWICYSCNRWGGAIDLVMTVKGIKFLDARQWLAQQNGIEIVGGRTHFAARRTKFVRNEVEEVKLETQPDHEVYAAYLAQAPLQASGREFLRHRALSDEIVTRFKIGQAPGIEGIRALILQFGFERVRAAGLLPGSASPELPSPIFSSGSLLFPYLEAGEIVYFQARQLTQSVKGCRWRNLNNRRRRLYNVDALSLPDTRRLALCEGAIDVLSAIQLGWEAVGLIGVSAQLTEPQMISLRGRQVDLLLDWDAAGEARAVRLRRELARYGVAATRKSRPSATAADVNEYLQEVG